MKTEKPSSKKSAPTPKILAVVNGKGGVGKTTTAVNLAAIWGEKQDVLLVDADAQGSATWWVERSKMGMDFDLSKETNSQLLAELNKIKDYNLIIIDTPPSLHSEVVTIVLKAANYLVLPTPPAPMDLTALIETVQTAVVPLRIAYRVLLTKVDSRSLKETLEAQNTLLELGIPTCNAFIRNYKAHERAVLEGLAIKDWRGKNSQEAFADYRRVAEELERDWQKTMTKKRLSDLLREEATKEEETEDIAVTPTTTTSRRRRSIPVEADKKVEELTEALSTANQKANTQQNLIASLESELETQKNLVQTLTLQVQQQKAVETALEEKTALATNLSAQLSQTQTDLEEQKLLVEKLYTQLQKLQPTPEPPKQLSLKKAPTYNLTPRPVSAKDSSPTLSNEDIGWFD